MKGLLGGVELERKRGLWGQQRGLTVSLTPEMKINAFQPLEKSPCESTTAKSMRIFDAIWSYWK